VCRYFCAYLVEEGDDRESVWVPEGHSGGAVLALVVDSVHLHGEALVVDCVLGASEVVAAPVEVHLPEGVRRPQRTPGQLGSFLSPPVGVQLD